MKPMGIRIAFHIFVTLVVVAVVLLAQAVLAQDPAPVPPVVLKPGQTVEVSGDCDPLVWEPLGVATGTVATFKLCPVGDFKVDRAVLYRSESASGAYVGVLHLVPVE